MAVQVQNQCSIKLCVCLLCITGLYFSNLISAFALLQASIARGLAYAPYADMLWMETSTPSLEEAKAFADAIHAKYPGI